MSDSTPDSSARRWASWASRNSREPVADDRIDSRLRPWYTRAYSLTIWAASAASWFSVEIRIMSTWSLTGSKRTSSRSPSTV